MRLRIGCFALLASTFFPVSAPGKTWIKSYGGSKYDSFTSGQQTADGGFIVAGNTKTFNNGIYDFWLLKLDAKGEIVWQKIYGGPGPDYAPSVREVPGGGFIVAGTTATDVTSDSDIWLLKLDASGNVVWRKSYTGSGLDEAQSLQKTSDGGFMVLGRTISYGAGNYDGWFLKLDSDGEVQNCDIIAESPFPVQPTLTVSQASNASATDTSFSPAASSAPSTDTNGSVEQQCGFDPCAGDFDTDLDVDGVDLSYYSLNQTNMDIEEFASSYGGICEDSGM
jgi:hypothetical protein